MGYNPGKSGKSLVVDRKVASQLEILKDFVNIRKLAVIWTNCVKRPIDLLEYHTPIGLNN